MVQAEYYSHKQAVAQLLVQRVNSGIQSVAFYMPWVLGANSITVTTTTT